MAYKIGEPTQQQFIDDNGDPATSHKLYFYLEGTTTPTNVAFDTAGSSVATTVTIGSNGYPQSGGSDVTIYYDEDTTYDIVRKDAADVAYGATIESYKVPTPSSTDTIKSVLSAGGSAADVITASLTPAPTSLVDQQTVIVELQHGANTTTTPTFNLNSLGAKTIVRDDDQALVVGDTGGDGYKLLLSFSNTKDSWQLLNPAKSGVSKTIYTSNDTHTPSSKASTIEFEVIGAGGGSGGCAATGGAQYSTGGAGGGGGYVNHSTTTVDTSYTIVVGSGGAGGTAGANAGSVGGDSSVTGASITLTGNGGAGGIGGTAIGSVIYPATSGGTASGGLFNVAGGDAGSGLDGGLSFKQTIVATATRPSAGVAGIDYGTGASGAASDPNESARAGAAGGDGIVIVTEY